MQLEKTAIEIIIQRKGIQTEKEEIKLSIHRQHNCLH